MVAKKSPAFEKAIADSNKLKSKPNQDELLDLYALFKQGSQDPPFDPATKPGTFDFKAKYKFSAWEKVVNEKVTPEQAQEKYVALVEKLKGVYGLQS